MSTPLPEAMQVFDVSQAGRAVGSIQSGTRWLLVSVGVLFLAIGALAVVVPISGSLPENIFMIGALIVLGAALAYGGSRMQTRILVEVGVGSSGFRFTYSDRTTSYAEWHKSGFGLRFQDNTKDESIDPFDRRRVIMFYLGDQVDDVTPAVVVASISEAQKQGVPVVVGQEEWRTRSGIHHPEVARLGAAPRSPE
jgi:hypothetical protein